MEAWIVATVGNISQYIGFSVIHPNLLDCLWYIPLNLKDLLICMTQFIGWTTTPEPLNLKAGLLYMTQYIWSYSFAAQSKLLPNINCSMTNSYFLAFPCHEENTRSSSICMYIIILLKSTRINSYMTMIHKYVHLVYHRTTISCF